MRLGGSSMTNEKSIFSILVIVAVATGLGMSATVPQMAAAAPECPPNEETCEVTPGVTEERCDQMRQRLLFNAGMDPEKIAEILDKAGCRPITDDPKS
jgi:hypothetical protein